MNKIKSAATEVTAQKTQTPIVAKLTLRENGCNHNNIINRICIFIKFNNVIMLKKSIPIPINKDSTPVIHVYLVSLAEVLYHTSKENAIEKQKTLEKNRELLYMR